MKGISVKELRPKVTAVALPQCEARRSGRYCSDIIGVVNQCKRNATIFLDGKNLCRTHAGEHALALLIQMSETKKEPSQ